MKKLFVFLVLSFLLTACKTTTLDYDLNIQRQSLTNVKSIQVQPIKIGEFKYEPHKKISPYTETLLGCLFCGSDGGSSGFTYNTSIKDIVKTEVEMAFSEVRTASQSKNNFSLNCIIHLFAWNCFNGDCIVDLTYTLSVNDEIKYIKRFYQVYDSPIFKIIDKKERGYSIAIRKTVDELLLDNNFIELVKLSDTDTLKK